MPLGYSHLISTAASTGMVGGVLGGGLSGGDPYLGGVGFLGGAALGAGGIIAPELISRGASGIRGLGRGIGSLPTILRQGGGALGRGITHGASAAARGFSVAREFLERDIEWEVPSSFWGRNTPWMSSGSPEKWIADKTKRVWGAAKAGARRIPGAMVSGLQKGLYTAAMVPPAAIAGGFLGVGYTGLGIQYGAKGIAAGARGLSKLASGLASGYSGFGSGFQGLGALGLAGAGAVLGASTGAGWAGAGLGAAAGLAVGGVGPKRMFAGGKALWKSGPLGKTAVLGVAGAAVAGGAALGLAPSADAYHQGLAASAKGLALMAPAAIVSGAAGLGGLMSMRRGVSAGAAFKRAAFGRTGNIMKSAIGAIAKNPGKAGAMLGMAMGAWSLLSGVADMAFTPDEGLGSVALGSQESLYGMDPNNLDTQALTLALHYRQQ